MFSTLKNASAIVTGGSSGLGLATVKRLLDDGCKVMIADIDRPLDSEILGDNCLYHQADVSSANDMSEVIESVRRNFNSLHILINCAGIGASCDTYDFSRKEPHSLELFENILKVNTVGTFNAIRLAVSLMAENEADVNEQRGVIINTSSIASFEGSSPMVAYAVSKAALNGMTLPVARNLSHVGIRVMTIAPSLFDTPILAGITDGSHLKRKCVSPKRLGKPEEFADFVCAIIRNPMLNGEVVRLDGANRISS